MINKYNDYKIICLDALTYAGNMETLEPVKDNPNLNFIRQILQIEMQFMKYLKKKNQILL